MLYKITYDHVAIRRESKFIHPLVYRQIHTSTNYYKVIIVQAFMHVLVTCKNEEDPFKNEGAGVLTTLLSLKVYGDFSRASRTANSAVLGPTGRISNSFKMLWMCLLPAKINFFSIITLWELSVAMETRVLIRSDPKSDAAFPQPQ